MSHRAAASPGRRRQPRPAKNERRQPLDWYRSAASDPTRAQPPPPLDTVKQPPAIPTSPPRTLPFLAGGIQVIRIGRVVPALSGRNSVQSSYVLPAGFTTRRRYTSATDPTKKVWYESTVEVRSSASDSQQPATNDCKKGTGKKDAGKEKEGFVVIVHEVGNPALTWRGTSPTHAWQQVIAAVNVRAKARKKAAVSGRSSSVYRCRRWRRRSRSCRDTRSASSPWRREAERTAAAAAAAASDRRRTRV